MKALGGRGRGMFAVAVLLVLSGCAIYQGEFSALANRELDLAGLDLDKARRKGRFVESAAERQIFVLVPDRDDFPTLEEAIDRALEQGGGDLILDARVFRWHWYIPCVYGSSGWRVAGEVVHTGSGGVKPATSEAILAADRQP